MKNFPIKYGILASAIGLLAAPAIAADLPVYEEPVAVAAAAPYDWTGFYIGGVAGYGFGEGIHCDNPTCTGGAPTFPSPEFDGFLGGITVGYNHQFVNSVVIGIEADYSWAGMDGAANSTATYGCGGVAGCRTEIDGFGTVRARLGYAFDRFLPYLTAGVAFTDLFASIGTPVLASDSTFEASFTGGAGMEVAITQNWSTKLEYLYVDDPGNFNFAPAFCVAPGCQVEDNDYHVVRAGINFRW